nr:hypothetical protein [Candidatus Sigynarchaeota archaeon]
MVDGVAASKSADGSRLKGWVKQIGAKLSKGKEVRLEAKSKEEELWNTVGYHRITGGFFYSYILMIGGAIIGLLTLSWLLPLFLPYPEINGYRGIVQGTILGLWFGMFDFNLGGGGGFSDGVSRFIGQYSDTNPRRAVKYIQFYIWWQMWTGLVQITLFIFLAFFYFVHTGFAYLSWFIIAVTLEQYPGMLMIMESSLHAFQRGDKTAWLSWLQDTFFQVTVNIVFLIIGKWWGSTHPEVGELMGITFFYILSQFMDDWINLAVGGKMFASVLKPYGIRMRDVFGINFDKSVIKDCLKYTGKQWIAGQIWGVFSYFIGIYIALKFPSMATWSGLMTIANAFGNLARLQGPMMGSAVPAFSESFNNGKKELCRYFIHDSLKYFMFITIFMAVSLVVLASRLLEFVIVAFPELKYYTSASVLIPTVILVESLSPLTGLPDKIFNACHRPLTPIILGWILTPLGYVLNFLFLYWAVDVNVLPTWTLMLYPGFILNIVRTIIAFAWMQKKLIRIDYKKIAFQVFVAPVLAAVAYFAVLWLFSYTAWPALNALFSAIISAVKDPAAGAQYGVLGGSLVVIFLVLFVFPYAMYGPFSGLFGGWDDFTLEEFKKCALISGPSKGITILVYKSFAFFSKLSPWFNKHPMNDYTIVQREAEELIAEGKANKILTIGKKK